MLICDIFVAFIEVESVRLLSVCVYARVEEQLLGARIIGQFLDRIVAKKRLPATVFWLWGGFLGGFLEKGDLTFERLILVVFHEE